MTTNYTNVTTSTDPRRSTGMDFVTFTRYAWHRWADILAPRPGTETLATYADRYYAGRAAATTRRLGRGTVTMIGVSTDDGALEQRLLRDVYRRAGVAIEDLPKGVFLEWRDGLNVAVNYSPANVPINVPAGAQVLHGRAPLAPAGVLVWTEPPRSAGAR